MRTRRSSPSRSLAERGSLAAGILLVLLAGCAGRQPLRPAPPPAEAPAVPAPAADPRVEELEAEVRTLRGRLRRLEAENAELRAVIERLKALDLDLERKRREVR